MQISVPRLNDSIASWNTRRVGSRSSSHPVIGMTTAMVSMNAVVNHCAVRSSIARGAAWALASGAGEIMGAFVIESINTTGTVMMDDGRPRRIEFTLQLARVDDQRSGRRVAVGDLGDFAATTEWGW